MRSFLAWSLVACACVRDPGSSESVLGETHHPPPAPSATACAACPERAWVGGVGGVGGPSPRGDALQPSDGSALEGASPAPSPRPLGVAAHAAGGITLFDLETGAVVRTASFAGAVLDVAWHALLGRVFVVERDPDLDAMHLHALDESLEPVAGSEPVSGIGRVWPTLDQVLFVHEEIGATWSLRGADLVAIGPSQTLARPASLANIGAATGHRFLALDTHRLDGAHSAVGLSVIEFAGSFTASTAIHRTTGSTGCRMAHTAGATRSWLLRPVPEGSAVDVAPIEHASPLAAPRWTRVPAPELTGADFITAASLDDGATVVAVTAAELLLVSLAENAVASVWRGGSFESSEWATRIVATSANRVLVGTAGRVVALALDAAAHAAEDPAFDGRDLRAPLALKGTW